MQARELTTLIVVGGALVVIGLTPGLLDTFVEAIRSFSASLSSPFPMVARVERTRQSRHPWLAVIGFALILLSLFAISK